MFDSAAALLPATKRAACEKSWAGPFREKALPILLRAEQEFAEFYDDETGRPNRSVALVLGTLVLKEASDLTDDEVLDALRFDTRWWCAFDLKPEEAELCQKTLHNFRAKLMEREKGAVVFRRLTDELIAALGVRVDRQRLDSTHILSNFARLNRLGLFCETIRVFLHALKKGYRDLHDRLPAGLLKRHGEASWYRDARREEGPRRLGVVARDLYRLVERFKGHRAIGKMEEYRLLERLLSDQCKISEKAAKPRDDDDDRDDGAAPVELKDPKAKEIKGDSLQTPHDPDVTYSGHKGKGYEVQVSETCMPDNPVELITEVKVTPSAGSDATATIPAIEALDKAGHKPKELVADTTYSGATNAAEAAKRGVNLLAPAPAMAKPEPGKVYPAPDVDCPTGRTKAGAWLKSQEAQPDFQRRYAIRAGIEATNSELKRVQGLGKLRVRRDECVKLVVYLKAAGCNLRRALRHWIEPGLAVEGATALA
ncbi:MAG: transposase [Elusimicrobia bacterium]|nr:transposase [Elusimicrobiota bacterium]